jgi:predicted dehydrogenase
VNGELPAVIPNANCSNENSETGKKMINCALIGVGYWGSILKKYLEKDNRFSLKYACNSKFDLRKIWNDKTIDAVVVATPIDTHYTLVKSALLAGKHVLSEKPLALKAEQCLDLKHIAEKNGLVLQTEYVYTFSEALKKAKQILQSGELGKVLALELSVKHLGRFGSFDVYWLLASHMLSVLDMFCPLSQLSFSFVDLVKNETGMIIFDGPVKGTICVSLNYPWKQAEVLIYCENGTLRYNPGVQPTLSTISYSKPKWTVSAKIPKTKQTYPFDEGHNIRLALSSFHDCIVGKEKPNTDLAVEITRIIEKRTK